ncbi:MAG: 4a-hydroxytetrahydrobiopterin dehydratase [Verrucomicrobiales bacterium]|jgi:4a-hydroxytetrahydrobiopterin dehydratase
MSDKVRKEDLPRRMKRIPEWEIKKERLVRVFEFDEYMDAIDFINGVAEIAEDANHHPDIIIRYTTVTLSLTSHDQAAITERDFELASRLNTLID